LAAETIPNISSLGTCLRTKYVIGHQKILVSVKGLEDETGNFPYYRPGINKHLLKGPDSKYFRLMGHMISNDNC